jgi:hypothetical protein
VPASWRPPATAAAEIPLRRGVAPKTLGPSRRAAREAGAAAIDVARRRAGVSQAELGDRLDASVTTATKTGGQACSGSLLVSIGEGLLLLPLVVAVLVVVQLLGERLRRAAEAIEPTNPERATRYRVAADHLRLIRTLVEHG